MADKQTIFTTKKMTEIKEKHDMGYKISRDDKYWFKNMISVKRDGLTFSYTDEELMEYMRCKMGIDEHGEIITNTDFQTVKQTGIQYFSENYCSIKREDGSVGEIRLRDYQNDILDLYMDNRFSILSGSRQIGKCFLFDTQVVTNNNSILETTSVFRIYYKNKKNKTIIDNLKYAIYSLIEFIKYKM